MRGGGTHSSALVCSHVLCVPGWGQSPLCKSSVKLQASAACKLPHTARRQLWSTVLNPNKTACERDSQSAGTWVKIPAFSTTAASPVHHSPGKHVCTHQPGQQQLWAVLKEHKQQEGGLCKLQACSERSEPPVEGQCGQRAGGSTAAGCDHGSQGHARAQRGPASDAAAIRLCR